MQQISDLFSRITLLLRERSREKENAEATTEEPVDNGNERLSSSEDANVVMHRNWKKYTGFAFHSDRLRNVLASKVSSGKEKKKNNSVTHEPSTPINNRRIISQATRLESKLALRTIKYEYYRKKYGV